MLYPRRYAAFDTETTGLNTDLDEVVELGVKVVEKDGTSKFKSWLIKGDRPSCPEAFAAHGITQEVRNGEGVSFAEAYGEFVEIARGFPLIGHNILRFDNLLLKRDLVAWMLDAPNPEYVARADSFLKVMETGMIVDTAALYKARELKSPRYWYERHVDHANRVLDVKAFGLKFNLKFVSEKLGVDLAGIKMHRVEGDVELVDRIYKKLAL